MATLFLANVIGWYLVISCLYVIVRYQHVKSLMAEVVTQRALFMVLAAFTVIIGLLLVTSHNIWVRDWPVLITLFSWTVLIAGILRLYVPELAISLNQSLMNNNIAIIIVCILGILLGGYLLLHVYPLSWLAIIKL